jgi:hypothetical protein
MEIKLTNSDKVAICSSEHFKELSNFKWRLNIRGYVVNQIDESMHGHVIKNILKMEIPKGYVIDHIKGDRLDNRKESLRIVTRYQNACNKKKKKGTLSLYKGVTYDKRYERWKAYIRIDGKKKFLGSFDNELEAAEMYDRFLAYRKQEDPNEIRELNFPEDYENYLKEALILPSPKRRKYIGVYKRGKGYYASIKVDYVDILLLRSKSEEKCARAWDSYVVKHKLNRRLNFPDEHKGYVPDKKIKTYMIEVDEKTVRLIIKNHTDMKILIDMEDYEKVKYYTCFIAEGLVKIIIKDYTRLLSRYLMNVSDPDIYIDHIYSDPLDNRKGNLRRTDAQHNSENKKKREGTSSKYLDVVARKLMNRMSYCVRIQNKKKMLFQKSYDNEEHAARARDLVIKKKIPDSHYKMNFVWTADDVKKWVIKLFDFSEEDVKNIIKTLL